MNKVKKIEQYLYDYISNRFEDIDSFYRITHRNRQEEIYKLKNGPKLMDFLISIHGNIEEYLLSDKFIPHKFTSPNQLFIFLNNFRKYIIEKQCLINENFEGENTSYIITELKRISDDLLEMIDYVRSIYDNEDTRIPYQDLRYSLITKNISEFIKILISILASVSYSISKTKEGYYHSNVHLILKLLGFDIVSEEETNKDRIDAIINFSDTIFIVEFKFSESEDLSKVALLQIENNNYAQKYYIENKEIIAIGISFSEIDKNINGFCYKNIY